MRTVLITLAATAMTLAALTTTGTGSADGGPTGSTPALGVTISPPPVLNGVPGCC
ncbi:MAG: hypothetical protein JWN57_3036 [Frankiales bacterium]|jgi:hypothetical protein|nr:hypothetical protein [Frankiales bacterium]